MTKPNLNRSFLQTVLLTAMLSGLAVAQGRPNRAPTVELAPTLVNSIPQGTADTVELDFRVSPGFHVNSNKPKSELLIPTVLKLNPPTDIVIGRVSYPLGQEVSFPFAPDEKLSVYSATFTVKVVVRPLASVIPGKYIVRGQLKYQACDNAACYPPRLLPLDFEVRIVKSSHRVRRNPAQSPHAR
jgi:Thiol:disulfide interchange protein DsbD, N-terminal